MRFTNMNQPQVYMCSPAPPSHLLPSSLSTCRGGTPALRGATAEAARAPQSVYRRRGALTTTLSQLHRPLLPFLLQERSQRRCHLASLQYIPVASVTPPGSLVSLSRSANTITSGTSEGHCSVKRVSPDSPIAPLTKEPLLRDQRSTRQTHDQSHRWRWQS